MSNLPTEGDYIRLNQEEHVSVSRCIRPITDHLFLVEDEHGEDRYVFRWIQDDNDTRKAYRDARSIQYEFAFNHNQVGMSVHTRFSIDKQPFGQWCYVTLVPYGETLDTNRTEKEYIESIAEGLQFTIGTCDPNP